jgi:hypothetical protein
MSMFEFESETFPWFYAFTLILILCEELCLLVLCCAGSRYDMMGNDEDLDRSRRPVVEDRDGQTQVGYSVAGRSGGHVTSCAICIVHMEMMSVNFLVELQNQGRRFSSLGLKIGCSGLMI